MKDAHRHSMAKKAFHHLFSKRGLLRNVCEGYATARWYHCCDAEVSNRLLTQRVIMLKKDLISQAVSLDSRTLPTEWNHVEETNPSMTVNQNHWLHYQVTQLCCGVKHRILCIGKF
jgi:hypothetical protein